MNNLRRIFNGHFLVKSISVGADEDKICIHFHRYGNWNIFGWRNHKNRYYYRKHSDKYTRVFRYKCTSVAFIYSATNWLVEFYPKAGSLINSNIVYLAYLLYIIYVLLK